jgi:3-methyladenine DNA glycosylase AlkD
VVLDVDLLRHELVAVAHTEQAEPMAAYMKHHFAFLGVKTPARRTASRPMFAAARTADIDEVLSFADRCWAQPEREFQYVGSDVLAREAKRLGPHHLGRIEALITTKSWWDTVDALAAHVVGTMVRGHRALTQVMDRWIDADDLWLARTAILHQLRWKTDTDAGRLFSYSERRATDPEFFIRKAIGWALREFAKTDPDAVRTFVDAHADEFSELTKREALKHL